MSNRSSEHANCSHGHHRHAHNTADERRRLKITVAITIALFIAEVVGGFLSGSVALLSDATHMLSDVVAQVLALVAMVAATRPADARRTWGWHRLEILAAFANGALLFVLAGAIFYGGIQRLRSPVEIKSGLMIGIAAAGLVANLVGAWLLHGATSLNVRGAYLHILLDTLSSVAVLIGGVAIWFRPSLGFLDPVLSMIIAVFILYSAYRLLREAADVLLETVPQDIDLGDVLDAMRTVAGVGEIHDLHIWTITSGRHALSAHVVVDREEMRDSVLHSVGKMLVDRFAIHHVTLQVEAAGFEHSHPVCT
jgi:cobalt-zinc-cadmium efflux system protein